MIIIIGSGEKIQEYYYINHIKRWGTGSEVFKKCEKDFKRRHPRCQITKIESKIERIVE
jgi:uncharacterized protein YllA (UPF0747 family)